MASYDDLTKIYYRAGSEGEARLNAEYLSRIKSESAFVTNINIDGDPLFLTVPKQLSLLSEAVLRKERRISNISRELPEIARAALIRKLIFNEVACSNEIEGVHSTRKQIQEALDSANHHANPTGEKRFREFARLYLSLSDQQLELPQSPKDIRLLFDGVMDGELDKNTKLDGALFRKDPVTIESGTKTIHEGVWPEDEIIRRVAEMIDLANSEEMPQLYSALLAHYYFEFIHPFYDGNGRTGRLLLAMHLSEPLSIITALSVSRGIAENRKKYYAAFESVEKRLNKHEGTMFVISLMEIISDAQDKIIETLTESLDALNRVSKSLNIASDQIETDISSKEIDILYQLAQTKLFGFSPEVRIAEIADYIGAKQPTARKYAAALEQKGLIKTKSLRPLSFVLTKHGEERLSINDHRP